MPTTISVIPNSSPKLPAFHTAYIHLVATVWKGQETSVYPSGSQPSHDGEEGLTSNDIPRRSLLLNLLPGPIILWPPPPKSGPWGRARRCPVNHTIWSPCSLAIPMDSHRTWSINTWGPHSSPSGKAGRSTYPAWPDCHKLWRVINVIQLASE